MTNHDLLFIRTEYDDHPNRKIADDACWLCGGEKSVDWWGIDEEGNHITGTYDPCPQCSGSGTKAEVREL